MKDKFFNIHLIQASLQTLNVPMDEIEKFLTMFESLSASPEAFARWNTELDEKGIRVLSMILDTNGKKLAQACLQSLFTSFVNHYQITDREIAAEIKREIDRIISSN